MRPEVFEGLPYLRGRRVPVCRKTMRAVQRVQPAYTCVGLYRKNSTSRKRHSGPGNFITLTFFSNLLNSDHSLDNFNYFVSLILFIDSNIFIQGKTLQAIGYLCPVL